MIHEDCSSNLMHVLRVLGQVDVSVLKKFFSDDIKDENIVGHFIDLLVARHYIYYVDKEKTKVRLWNAHVYQKPVQERLEDAFLVLSDFGSKEILTFQLGDYPTMIIFVTTNGEVYDITSCSGERDMQLALRQRNIYRNTLDTDEKERPLSDMEMPDLCSHIALVPNKDDGKIAKKYGFSSYAVVSRVDKTVSYYQ